MSNGHNDRQPMHTESWVSQQIYCSFTEVPNMEKEDGESIKILRQGTSRLALAGDAFCFES